MSAQIAPGDPHTLTIEADCSTDAQVIEETLHVEAEDLITDRSRTTVDREGSIVSLHIEASDLIALRAAANTWLGLLGTAESTLDVLKPRV